MEKIGKRKKGVIPMSTLKKNQKGKIAFIRGDNKTLRRLFGLGLTPGTKISISRTAPLKGPVEIAVRGSRVTLEDKIASNVFVEKTANEQREQYYD